MKTLSEHKKEAEERAKRATQKHHEYLKAFVESAKAWLIPEGVEVNSEAAKRARRGVYGELTPINIACDHCRFELVSTSYYPLMSNPPKRRITCPCCGWQGYQSTSQA